MAESKLNLNAPLLSTRRMQKQNTAVSVRRNKTFKFTDDSKTSFSCVPVLVSDMDLEQVTESGSVPFTWEQAPGRLKGNDSRPQEVCDPTQQVFTPCLPPGKVMDNIKCPVEKAVDGNLSSKGKQVEEEESEDDDDDVFSDARDTLSPKNSFSVNHSVSGVSGYGGVVEKKKTLNLSEDGQSRDFMLNRFLPAAKAMTVEQPHYASNRKSSSFMSEPTMQIRGLVPEQKRQTPKRYDESIVVPYYDHQDINDEESEEDEDKDDEVSEYAYSSKRGCGMLPQLCFRESVAMLNTVPGFKAKHNSPIASLSHDQVKSSKVSQLKSRFQSVKKLALDSVSKHKSSGKIHSPVHPSMGKKFSSESNLTAAENRFSSPYRHPRCMSPFRSAGKNSSPFQTACFPDTRKETENLRANRLNKHIRSLSRSQELLYPKDNGSASSLLEKTVYVDTENSPMTNDQHNSNFIISSEEEDKGGKKPDADLELEGFENFSIRSGEMVNVDELGKINNGPDRSHLAPPSPKKPSESWLLHNLPSVTSQIPSRRYPFHPQKHKLNENSRNVTKWETIVKTSHMHRDHIRYSEELVAHTSLQ